MSMDQDQIKLLASINWTATQWDLSFEEIIPLKQILPQINSKYEVCLEDNEAEHINAGIHHVLWLPPHSEFNSLEMRPKEVLKAHIIEVELYPQEWMRAESLSQSRKCEIQVKSISKLLDACHIKGTPYKLKFDDNFYSSTTYYKWDHYIIIFRSDQYLHEALLFSSKDEEVTLLFVNSWLCYQYECLVLNQPLSAEQKTQLFNLLNKHPPLIPEIQIEVAIDQVQGALYW